MRISLLIPVLCAGLLAMPPAAAAQEVKIPAAAGSPFDPAKMAPQLPAPSITLSDAVRLTVQHDATIAIARQDVSAANGRLVETTGVFDPVFMARTTFGWNHTALQPFLRSREERTRLQLETLAEQFGFIDAELRRSLATLSPRPPVCPVGFDFTVSSGRLPPISIDRLDPAERNLRGIQQDLGSPVAQSIVQGFSSASLSTVCTPPAEIGLPVETIRTFWGQADRATNGALGLNPFLANTQQFPHELIGAQQQLAETISTRAALGRARIGDVPLDEVRRDVAFEANWNKFLRSGWSYGAQLRLLSNQHTFVDKALDPSFGGVADPILFPSFFTLNLTVPLARGGGRRSVAAPERAAALTLRAETDRTRHTVTESAFRTVLSYLNLIAAQERQRYLEESQTRQKQMLDTTQQLVTAGDLPQAELDRTRARSADAAAAVADARIGTLEARVALADTIGVSVGTIENLPVAQGRFAEPLALIPGPEALTTAAMDARRDRRALQLLKDAAGLLVNAAHADLRHKYDVTISGGIANTYDNALFRFLPDELSPIFNNLPEARDPEPTLPPVRFSSAQGFGRSLSGRWEPFFGLSVTYEMPYVNNRFGGRALQAEASLRRSTVEMDNIDRIIRDNVVHAAGSLRATAETIQHRRNTIELQRKTLEGTLLLLRAGDLTLINTLTTEEDLTREQLQLVADLLTYFSTLARLRFETGQLVQIEGEGASETVVFSSREFIAQ